MHESKMILVVEDEKSLREALVDKLGREGFQVMEASNGAEGLERVAVQSPDLILLDMVMPVMDGLTMLTRLRKIPGMEDVPVIALTNLNSMDNIAAIVSGGANTYLVKSNWKIADVVQKVKEQLR